MNRPFFKLLSTVFTCFFAISLSACSFFHVHHPDVQQGNIIDAKLIKRLKPGMRRTAVMSALGNPVLSNAFRPDLVNYVYSLKVQSSPTVIKRLTLTFRHDVLVRYQQSDY